MWQLVARARVAVSRGHWMTCTGHALPHTSAPQAGSSFSRRACPAEPGQRRRPRSVPLDLPEKSGSLPKKEASLPEVRFPVAVSAQGSVVGRVLAGHSPAFIASGPLLARNNRRGISKGCRARTCLAGLLPLTVWLWGSDRMLPARTLWRCEGSWAGSPLLGVALRAPLASCPLMVHSSACRHHSQAHLRRTLASRLLFCFPRSPFLRPGG